MSNYNQPQIGYTSVGIGSTANYGFLQFFGTSNTLCWTANGTVGINKTNPAATLDVNGTVSTNGTLTLNNSTFVKNATTSGYNLIIEGGSSVGSPYTSFYAAGVRRGYIGNATTTTMELVAENGTSLNFYTAATKRMMITTTGLVGIGNIIPDNTLTVKGVFQLTDDLNGVQKYAMYSYGNVFFINPRNSSGGFNSIEGLSMNTSGNVGIGTTNPGTLLHLRSSGAERFRMEQTGTDPNYMRFVSSGTTYAFFGLENSAGEGLFGSNTAYGLSLGTPTATNINFATNNVVRTTLTSAGNLGIRTTGPVGLLSVLLDGSGINGPGTWSSSYALFGPGANSTTGSNVGITYNTASNYGSLMSLTAGVAWRNMVYSANEHYFYVTGTQAGYVNAGGFNNGSDEREKINIKNINTGKSLQRILECTPKTFQRIMDRTSPMIPDEVKNKWHIGLIAQEVLSINPHCISEWTNQDGEARYGINYTDFVTHLIGSVQELSKKITSQDELIQAQEAKMATLHGTCASLQARLDALEALVATSS